MSLGSNTERKHTMKKMTKNAMAALSEKAMEIANEAAEETKRLLKELDDYESAHPFGELFGTTDEEWHRLIKEWVKPVEALFDKLVEPVETLRDLTEKFENVANKYSDLVQEVDDYAEDWCIEPTYARC